MGYKPQTLINKVNERTRGCKKNSLNFGHQKHDF